MFCQSLLQLSNRLEAEFPGASFSQESRACSYMLNRKYEDAAKVYKRIIAKQPNNFNSIYDLSRVHIQLDEHGKAKTLLKKVRN